LRLDGEKVGLDRVRRFEPEVVGIQCAFTTERFRVVRLAQQIKQQLPETLVVVGGHDASRDPGWFMHQGIDAVAV
ncbi:MAG: hypothetical protein GTN89_07405, partial [Acidobacteria bacterium]|nr:hypothetical protein [Acidobacteriota bacterium]NIQ30185.1 hypothetical protein [Acidobacteriota bacterium]NIQ85055.1 hypothetical protein [Acidobacteriota bacterium]